MTLQQAMETQAMADVRVGTMRNVAANFLNNTKALHLERDLVEFLLEIDLRHREEVDYLNKALASALSK